jgi:uncharacterized protein YaaW (UPF0174 family)
MIGDDTFTFLVVSELFKRYTLIVDPIARRTSVYCDECDEWVADYEGERVTQDSPEELLEKIVRDHDEKMNGEKIEFDEPKHFYM